MEAAALAKYAKQHRVRGDRTVAFLDVRHRVPEARIRRKVHRDRQRHALRRKSAAKYRISPHPLYARLPLPAALSRPPPLPAMPRPAMLRPYSGALERAKKTPARILLMPHMLPITDSNHYVTLLNLEDFLDLPAGVVIAHWFPCLLVARDLVLEKLASTIWTDRQTAIKRGRETTTSPMYFEPNTLLLKLMVLQPVAAMQWYLKTNVYTPVPVTGIRSVVLLRPLLEVACAGRAVDPTHRQLYLLNLLPNLVHATLVFKVQGWLGVDDDFQKMMSREWFPADMAPFSEAMLEWVLRASSAEDTLGLQESHIGFKMQAAMCYPTWARAHWSDMFLSPCFEVLMAELSYLERENPTYVHATMRQLFDLATEDQRQLLPYILPALFPPRQQPPLPVEAMMHVKGVQRVIDQAADQPRLFQAVRHIGEQRLDQAVEAISMSLLRTGTVSEVLLDQAEAAYERRLRTNSNLSEYIHDKHPSDEEHRTTSAGLPPLEAHALVHFLQDVSPVPRALTFGLLHTMYHADKVARAQNTPACRLCSSHMFSVLDYQWAAKVPDALATYWNPVSITVGNVWKIASVNWEAAVALYRESAHKWFVPKALVSRCLHNVRKSPTSAAVAAYAQQTISTILEHCSEEHKADLLTLCVDFALPFDVEVMRAWRASLAQWTEEEAGESWVLEGAGAAAGAGAGGWSGNGGSKVWPAACDAKATAAASHTTATALANAPATRDRHVTFKSLSKERSGP